MTRLPDWPERLAELFAAMAGRAFCWGVHDCCTFAAEAVQVVTGADPLADLRGRWSSRAEAQALLGALGGLEVAVTARLGPAMPNHRLAQRGDIAMVDTAAGPALAVCAGSHLLAPGLSGVARVDLFGGQVLAAWGVGNAAGR